MRCSNWWSRSRRCRSRASLTLLTPVFAWAYGEDGAGSVFSTVRIACSFAVLLVPGVALGATFPMAVRVAVTSPDATGRAGGPAVWRQHGWRRDRLAGGRLRPHPDPRPHGHDADRHGGECRRASRSHSRSSGATSLSLCLRTRQPSRASSGRMPGTIARSRKPVAPRQTSMVGTPSGVDTDLQQQCWRLQASRRSCTRWCGRACWPWSLVPRSMPSPPH